MILKLHYKTPGREDDNQETKLYTRSDVDAKKQESAATDDTVSSLILEGLGGKENISDLDCCATRLRITVVDESKVNDAILKQSGASGVIRKGKGVQIIYGPRVAVIKSHLEEYIEQLWGC